MGQDSWDTDLVKDILNDRVVNLILSTPIQRMDNYSWFWRKDKMIQYTMKFFYLVMRDIITINHSSSNSGFWNKIWNLKIPLKVKHFVWRTVTSCLPNKDCLISRRVEVDNMCPVCYIYEETILHVLVTCHIAALCWQNLGYTHYVHTNMSMEDWTAEVLQHGRKNVINKVFMVVV